MMNLRTWCDQLWGDHRRRLYSNRLGRSRLEESLWRTIKSCQSRPTHSSSHNMLKTFEPTTPSSMSAPPNGTSANTGSIVVNLECNTPEFKCFVIRSRIERYRSPVACPAAPGAVGLNDRKLRHAAPKSDFPCDRRRDCGVTPCCMRRWQPVCGAAAAAGYGRHTDETTGHSLSGGNR